jgi:hypothetical protein
MHSSLVVVLLLCCCCCFTYNNQLDLTKMQSVLLRNDPAAVALLEPAANKGVFLQYEISPSKYHGGILKGLDCHEVMSQVKSLFFDSKT